MEEMILTNPATETICGRYPLMKQSEIETIIETMHHSQQAWVHSQWEERQQALTRLNQRLLIRKQEIANLITNEMGKPIREALLEVEKCARLCQFYAEHGQAFLQPECIETSFYKSYRSFHPLGIIFAIMPWNFPLWQVMRFAVPNLMAGNGGLLKHAPNSTGTGLLIEQLIIEAGFPESLFRTVVIDIDLSPFIINHPHVMGVTLTGSNQAGKQVAQTAGMAMKKVVLELGGSDPYIILEDADLERAAEQCIQSRLSNAGQICIAAKRIIVVDAVKATFERLIVEKAKAYVAGNPLEMSTLMGPMAREDLRNRLHDQVQRSIKSGARCVLGGTIPEGKGYFYPATVLLDVNIDSPAFHEELFGPVVCIVNAKDENQAISLANTTEFGLAAAVFTQDLIKGEHIANHLIEAGTCAVNTLVASDPRLPFGGIKQSGYGRELSIEGIREFVNIKTVIVAK